MSPVRPSRSRPQRRDLSRRPRRPLAAAPVHRLSVNHAHGAVPLDTRRLRFGWRLTDVAAVVAVQVIVGRTPGNVRAGTATVWDSGRRTVDDPDFSDLCLTASLGTGSGEIPLLVEEPRWWAVRVWDADGEEYEWSEPSRLLVSATVGAASAPRMVASVEGSLPTTAAQPGGVEGLYRWVTCQGAAAVWPLVVSTDVADRVGGWLDRLRHHLDPADDSGVALYAALLEAADLCYDEPDLRAEHGPTLTALRQQAGRRQPARVTSVGLDDTLDAPGFGGHFGAQGFGAQGLDAPQDHAARIPAGGAEPAASMTDLLAPLLGSVGSSTPLPVGIVVSEVAGLRATAPGFRSFRVEPCLLPQATEVDVEVDTARGPIVVRLRRRPDTLAGAQVTLGVPSGAVAKLVLPWSGEELTLDAGCYVFVND